MSSMDLDLFQSLLELPTINHKKNYKNPQKVSVVITAGKISSCLVSNTIPP
jgi:hypothetical protein